LSNSSKQIEKDAAEVKSESESDTHASDSHVSTNSSESELETRSTVYLRSGRLVNGIENRFELVTPLTVLESPFFKEFTNVPSDFDPETAVFFKAGF
ncbi:hypothetical protein EB077_10910, partial [bacterium]|nr:hypothetical protein [bacterium]